MPRWLRVALLAGVGVVVAGFALAVVRAVAYLESGQAISSTSGLVVFRVGDELAQYAPFEPGFEPTIVGLGVAIVLAAVFVAAVSYRSRVSSRASTADSNADAHTR